MTQCMRGSRKFCQRRSKFDKVFFFDEGIEDQNTAINGPSSAHQQNAIEMAFCWRANDGPTLNAGLVAAIFFQGIQTSIAKKPNNFEIFQGGWGPDPLSPPLDLHMQGKAE